MQQYIRHLVHERLGGGGKQELDQVGELMERLPWHEEEEFISKTIQIQVTAYSKFNDMDVMAVLLAALKRCHRAFVISIVDQVFEEVVRACERNDFKESQRRVAFMKFVSECYNFKIIKTDTLFDFLYKLMNIHFVATGDDGELIWT